MHLLRPRSLGVLDRPGVTRNRRVHTVTERDGSLMLGNVHI